MSWIILTTLGARRKNNSQTVMTHGHFDHVDALTDLADDWDVPV